MSSLAYLSMNVQLCVSVACVCVLAVACGRACVATKDASSFSSLRTKNVDSRYKEASL